MKTKKKAVIISLSVFVLCAVLLTAITCIGKKIPVYDKNGTVQAVVRWNGKRAKLAFENEILSDYISLAVYEALNIYGEKTGKGYDAQKEFFDKVTEIRTNLDVKITEKLYEAYLDSGINEGSAFSAVVTDKSGKIVASFGCGKEEGIYSTYKTYAGSAIKPLSVYTLAFESGKYNWSSAVMDSPVKKITTENGTQKDWPSNANGKYTNKDMLICDAVYDSINTVAVRVLQDISVKKSMLFLDKKLGILLDYEKELTEEKGEDEVLSNIALGYLYHGVSTVDMAGYYGIFPSGGMYTEPYTVTVIDGDDDVKYEAEPASSRVISSGTASVMCQLLKGVLYPDSTGKDAYVEGREIAGKSGTSDNYADNWFVGFSPEYVCAVWHENDGSGKNKSAAVFSDIMKRVPSGKKEFPMNENVVHNFYCMETGLIKGSDCYKVEGGYYLKNALPGICDRCGRK